MEEARVLRVLQDGGMVVPCQGGGAVYREQDQRRRAAGMIEAAQLDALINAALVRKREGESAGLIWAGERTDEWGAASAPISPPTSFQPKRQVRTALEHILRAEKNDKERAYLAAAAGRFGQDLEGLYRGQSITMNWEMIPRGKTRMGASAGGMEEISLNAARSLAQVEAALGQKDWLFLQDILVSAHSIKQLSLDYNVSRAKLARIGLSVFKRLARAYDMAVAPVRG